MKTLFWPKKSPPRHLFGRFFVGFLPNRLRNLFPGPKPPNSAKKIALNFFSIKKQKIEKSPKPTNIDVPFSLSIRDQNRRFPGLPAATCQISGALGPRDADFRGSRAHYFCDSPGCAGPPGGLKSQKIAKN